MGKKSSWQLSLLCALHWVVKVYRGANHLGTALGTKPLTPTIENATNSSCCLSVSLEEFVKCYTTHLSVLRFPSVALASKREKLNRNTHKHNSKKKKSDPITGIETLDNKRHLWNLIVSAVHFFFLNGQRSWMPQSLKNKYIQTERTLWRFI